MSNRFKRCCMGSGDRHSGGRDRISGLPDDLLHSILIHLRSAPAAARTSILSRRWRRVWAHLPELLLEGLNEPVLDSVDAALTAYSAPTLSRLEITVPPLRPNNLTAARVAPWLRFASQRLAGELCLRLPRASDEEELELPPCERIATIYFEFRHTLRLPPGSSFAALTVLRIFGARMEARDMVGFGASKCPRLQTLDLRGVTLVTVSDVSIHSETIEKLFFLVRNARRLEVVAPRLQFLRAPAHCDASEIMEARIVAPKLADVAWYGAYDPHHHQFVEAGSHLRQLLVVEVPMAALMRRFDTIDKLVVDFRIPPGAQGYQSFVKATNKLAKCEALEVHLMTDLHALASSVLHLLRKSAGVRKLAVRIPNKNVGSKRDACMLGCPCSSPESFRTDNISMDSLEEVIIMGFRGDHHVEFLNLLLGCNAPNLKNVTINVPEDAPLVSEDTCHKVSMFAHPNTEVKFNVQSHERWVPCVYAR